LRPFRDGSFGVDFESGGSGGCGGEGTDRGESSTEAAGLELCSEEEFGDSAGSGRTGECDPVKGSAAESFEDVRLKGGYVAIFVDDELFEREAGFVKPFTEYIPTAAGACPEQRGGACGAGDEFGGE
jgi:hypothetical protein